MSKAIDERAEEKAQQLGTRYGQLNKYAGVEARCREWCNVRRGLNRLPGASEAMYLEAIQLGCPSSWFDVFKYAAQAVWRSRGELV